MALLILAALIGIPLVEIMVFIKVGSAIGAFNTILITFLTAAAGLMLLRVQGIGVLMRARAALERQESPAQEIFEGIFLALAGLFLLIPGFVTDAVGFLLFLPPLRHALAAYMAKHSNFVFMGGGRANWKRSSRGGDGVIDGEYEVVDPDAPSLDKEDRDGGEGRRNPNSPWAGGR
ncbi:MAG: FxsA family protein [Alphaproteobacteria bacterium]|nr:MAG: FxsA family protein [Alphaproteobacteria bacterium]